MDILAESALRITVVALGVAVVLRALRIRSPRLAHAAWAAVVVIMLVLPVFVAWGLEFAVPLLPSRGVSALVAPAAGDIAPAKPDTIAAIAVPASTATQGPVTWEVAVGAVYVAGVALLLLRLALGLRRARAIRHGAIRVQGRLTHASCVAPITVGVFSPSVILPEDWARWDDAQLSAVLAHEEEHVRKRDPLVAGLALFNRAIFWFHPLAWWLQREIAKLSEQACDAAVLSSGHDREVYLSCLMQFARRVADAGGRVVPMSMAMPGGGLQERLGMLAQPQAPHPSGSRLACAGLAVAALVVLCAMATPTAAPRQDVSLATNQPGWVVDTSDHFDIFHQGLAPDRVHDAARDAEAAYAQLSAALKHEPGRRVMIVLVDRDRDNSAPAARVLSFAPGIDPPQNRIVISLESLDRRTGLIVHELTHQFAFDIVPDTSRDAPILIEGLAEHQRGRWEAEELRKTRAGALTGAIPSVARLASADRHWAHALFNFVSAEYGGEGIRRLLFALRAQPTLEHAVPVAFDVTLNQFDQGFRGYVATRFGRP